MNEIWKRLTPHACESVDVALASRGLLAAIMVLRGECGLDPAPGLHEAHEAVMQRQHCLIDRGALTAQPPDKALEVADVLITARSLKDRRY